MISQKALSALLPEVKFWNCPTRMISIACLPSHLLDAEISRSVLRTHHCLLIFVWASALFRPSACWGPGNWFPRESFGFRFRGFEFRFRNFLRIFFADELEVRFLSLRSINVNLLPLSKELDLSRRLHQQMILTCRIILTTFRPPACCWSQRKLTSKRKNFFWISFPKFEFRFRNFVRIFFASEQEVHFWAVAQLHLFRSFFGRS